MVDIFEDVFQMMNCLARWSLEQEIQVMSTVHNLGNVTLVSINCTIRILNVSASRSFQSIGLEICYMFMNLSIYRLLPRPDQALHFT